MVEKIVFLDIDGVLQPGLPQTRFEHLNDKNEMDRLYAELTGKYGDGYSRYFKSNILKNGITSVYYDWNKESMSELRRILDTTGAKIVISSDWRLEVPIDYLQDFFRIHDMADYVIDYTPDFDYEACKKFRETDEYKNIYESRCIEILEYLKAHPEVKRWVAIDDLSLDRYLDNTVITFHRLYRKDADKCIEILGVAE